MSQLLSWEDWLGLLDLFDTPYPNRPFTGEKWNVNLYAKMDDAKTEQDLIDVTRPWVLLHIGPTLADEGASINKHIKFWIRERGLDKDKNDPHIDLTENVFEDLRLKIYGNCKEAGRDYNNYFPCPPPDWHVYKNLPDWKAEFEKETKGKSEEWQQKFTAGRIKLADMKHKDSIYWRYAVMVTAERLGVSYAVMAGGLKKEF